MRLTILRVSCFLASVAAVVGCSDNIASNPNNPNNPIIPNRPNTESPTYTSEGPSSSGASNADPLAIGGAESSGNSAAVPAAASDTTKNGATATAPGGRVADVQEADVYRIADGKLYLLNTYRGFLVYDISNSQKPVRLSRLPVYGYPVEMFVENNTVYALLS